MSSEMVFNLVNLSENFDTKDRNFYKDQNFKPTRDLAVSRSTKIGIPSRNDEYWRFISPDVFLQPPMENSFQTAEVSFTDKISSGALKLVFYDGKLDHNQSNLVVSEDVEIIELFDKNNSNIPWVVNLYGSLEAKSQKSRPNGLASYNTALACEGVGIRVKPNKSVRIEIEYIRTSEHSDLLIHNIIKLEENSQLELVEKGYGAYRMSRLQEIDILKKAKLDHIRFFDNEIETYLLTQLFVRQAQQSRYKEFSLCINNKFLRNEIWICLEGKEAEVSLACASIESKSSLQDDTVFIEHLEEKCQSRQVFKKVLSDRAVGSFQGKIFVSPIAQKTDGYQISKGLILNEESKFLVKPELEIYADDVVCSHGSVAGAIDEESLFYLTSRGISREEATRMIIFAFLAETIKEITNETLSEEVKSIIAKKLEIKLD